MLSLLRMLHSASAASVTVPSRFLRTIRNFSALYYIMFYTRPLAGSILRRSIDQGKRREIDLGEYYTPRRT